MLCILHTQFTIILLLSSYDDTHTTCHNVVQRVRIISYSPCHIAVYYLNGAAPQKSVRARVARAGEPPALLNIPNIFIKSCHDVRLLHFDTPFSSPLACFEPASPHDLMMMRVKIHQRGVQWKQGVVMYMMLYTSLLCNTTPIHCTPLRLRPPLMSTQRDGHPQLSRLLRAERCGRSPGIFHEGNLCSMVDATL